jgi:hypothetical protein
MFKQPAQFLLRHSAAVCLLLLWLLPPPDRHEGWQHNANRQMLHQHDGLAVCIERGSACIGNMGGCQVVLLNNC